ncbi:type II toxin-antitoxin system HicB family antitoxin [Salicibibacter cibarius]|uniref:Type II toxin-antitoxin system HicB family antitoxin n=1 Tax=Salicibibacter cibarius TaxID=2743000 RepID=A0A7T7CA89_9BACI|nr:type II toxin-antitoxin system HicB family antitoxin [Salicibibacter cibarius]QQK74639.1 type II toxin-antitoxin system HicB family antitoxin [Salicibibacter cibarius]
MKKNRYIYPAIFQYADDGISVSFPDLPGCFSAGVDDEEALSMSKEAMALHLFGMEEDKDKIPEPTPTKQIKVDEGQSIVLIEVLMPPFRYEMWNQAVKKTLTIPKWMDDVAKDHQVNYSRLLQKALSDHLGIKENPYD